MSYLRVEVPEIPERRSEIVPARIARKVAPLFGVDWEGSPHGMTWVSDFAQITLNEIARGAPRLSKEEEQARQRFVEATDGTDPSPFAEHTQDGLSVLGDPTSEQGQVVGRGVHADGQLRLEIANATLNKYGPDTKAAVVLSGANVLFSKITEDIGVALHYLRKTESGAALDSEVQVAAHAALLLFAYRAQPALFVAASQAREVQHALTATPFDIGGIGELPLARCELSGVTAPAANRRGRGRQRGGAAAKDTMQPATFEVVDDTIEELDLQFVHPTAGPQTEAGRHDGNQPDPALSRRTLAGLLIRTILRLGRADSRLGLLRVHEHAPGRRRLEVFVTSLRFINDYLRQAQPLLDQELRRQVSDGDAEEAARLAARFAPRLLPKLPATAELERMRVQTRQTVLAALYMAARYVQQDRDLRRLLDVHQGVAAAELPATAAYALRLRDLAEKLLPEDDPVRAEITAHAAIGVIRFGQDRAGKTGELAEEVRTLRATDERVLELVRAGAMDVGTGLDLLSRIAIAVNAVHVMQRTAPDPALPPAEELSALLRERWDHFNAELASFSHDDQRLDYYRHNYAGFLAALTDSENDLRAALRLFREKVLPERWTYYQEAEWYIGWRLSAQVAIRAGVALAALLAERGAADLKDELTALHDLLVQVESDPQTLQSVRSDGAVSIGVVIAAESLALGHLALLEARAAGTLAEPIREDVVGPERLDQLLDLIERYVGERDGAGSDGASAWAAHRRRALEGYRARRAALA
ncbi:hypothetical protein [Allonocardiopsis opalescens]|uniref:Uncharacterized protein n=1 Tax=Allonocardiopsis opalescens TaxID=1144618 RepID=A0A2T0QCI3_9ACTN|nr:hypothetical protein [Allonocardiopsis opalescens]PRY01622.1 hypothetical protein CLV72_101205 [Allonocardiopsis opalescens]